MNTYGGAVRVNLLLALGLAFVLGLKANTRVYNADATRVYSSIMLITVIGLAAPGVFDKLFGADAAALRSDAISIALAMLTWVPLLAIATLLPMAPLLLTVFPLEQLLDRLLTMIF